MSKLARLAAFSGALALFVALASEDVLAQKKKKDAPTDVGNPAVPADYKALAKEVTGHVTSVGGSGMTIAFRVETYTYEQNPNYKPPKGTTGTGGNTIYNQQMQ